MESLHNPIKRHGFSRHSKTTTNLNKTKWISTSLKAFKTKSNIGSTFLYFGLIFAHFRLPGKDPVFNVSFTHTVTVSKTKWHFFKKSTFVKGKLFNNGVNCVIPWWHWSTFGSTKEIWRVRNVYWKLKQQPFVLTKIHPFQATIYFLIYYYFYLRSTVYMLSKMVWNYHQH